jgi:glutamyl-tRNA synthetase
LRNPDKSKLSKRKNPTSIEYYRRAGFLPEAVVNYLGLMAYTLPDGREMFSFDDLADTFDLGRVSLGGPVFDQAKLAWLNGRYLRETLDADALMARLKDWQLNDDKWARIIPLVQPRIEKMADVVPMAAHFFADQLDYDPQLLIPRDLDGEGVVRLLRLAQWELEKLREWRKDAIQGAFQKFATTEERDLRDVVAPFFVAMSGSTTSTPLFDSLEILGSDLTRRRIAYAIDALASAGAQIKGKPLRKLEKHHRDNY